MNRKEIMLEKASEETAMPSESTRHSQHDMGKTTIKVYNGGQPTVKCTKCSDTIAVEITSL